MVTLNLLIPPTINTAMKTTRKTTRLLPATLLPLLLLVGHGHANIVVNSSGYNGLSTGNVDTTSATDWGFVSNRGSIANDTGLFAPSEAPYDDVDFGSLEDGGSPAAALTTVKASPTLIGNVTFSSPGSGNQTSDATDPAFTFDSVSAYGSFRNFGASAQDVWTLDFTGLAVGNHVIDVYVGHTAGNRIFDMDVAGTGLTSFTDTMSDDISTISSGAALFATQGGMIVYSVDFGVTGAASDLSLTFGGISGGAGSGILAGYTVTSIPEPGSYALVAGMLGLTGIALRRRRS